MLAQSGEDLQKLLPADRPELLSAAIQLTTPYLALLWVASQELRGSEVCNATEVQFALVATTESLDQPLVTFCSGWHSVEES